MVVAASNDRWAMGQDDALALTASGNFAAFAELYKRYLCPVYRYVRSQTPNDAVAEDITAHVFFKALSSADTFRAEGSYRSWVFGIARNAIRTWRGGQRRAPVILEEVPESTDPLPCPATLAISKERRGSVWRAIADLSPAQREVVALHYIDEFTTEEVAELTKRSRGAVRILLHRARTKLRTVLEEEGLS